MSRYLKLILVLVILITITTSTYAIPLNALQDEKIDNFRQQLDSDIQKFTLRYKFIPIIKNISFFISTIFIYT